MLIEAKQRDESTRKDMLNSMNKRRVDASFHDEDGQDASEQADSQLNIDEKRSLQLLMQASVITSSQVRGGHSIKF